MNQIGQIGGLFAILTLCHFVADWLFQSHDEAMAKSTNWRVRARHCYIYTGLMIIPIMLLHPYQVVGWSISVAILFVSHFIEDTYLPVYWWAKYIRRPMLYLDLDDKIDEWHESNAKSKVRPLHEFLGMTYVQYAKWVESPYYRLETIEDFKEWAKTPLGILLIIAVDQTVHIAFLLLVAIVLVQGG